MSRNNDIPVVQATPLLRTTIRQKLTPFLPPPVVVALKRLDPQLEPYLGPNEPAVTLLGTLWIGLVLVWILRKVSTTFGGGKAIGGGGGEHGVDHDDEDDNDILLAKSGMRQYDATVLLCGPPWAGKTNLFHHLVYGSGGSSSKINGGEGTFVPTLSSLTLNVGFAPGPTRILDAPGHWGPQRALSLNAVDRLVLVMDATQPVARAADYLYAIFTASSKNARKIPILLACHKSQSPKAKNPRRLKLQLRTELERLAKLEVSRAEQNGGTPTKIDDSWDELLSPSNSFCVLSTSLGEPNNSKGGSVGLEELREYCTTGKMPST